MAHSDDTQGNQNTQNTGTYGTSGNWGQGNNWMAGYGYGGGYGTGGQGSQGIIPGPSGYGSGTYGQYSAYGGNGGYGTPGSWQTSGPHTGKGPRDYRRSDDRIREDVNERLTQHGHIDARDIMVSVDNGEVTLSGTVDSRQTKRMAEDVAEGVSGVKDVHNRIRVRQAGQQDQGQPQNQAQSSVTSH